MTDETMDCPICKGTGKVVFSDAGTGEQHPMRCLDCHGKGTVSRKRGEALAERLHPLDPGAWCRCEPRQPADVIMRGEACTCGLGMEHVHCITCRKLLEAG